MTDIIIIGAGAIGASIARELSKYELDILLLEKNTEACQETTKANSAIIHGGYDAPVGSLQAKLNVEGTAMFQTLSEELEFTYKNVGSLVLAFNEEDKLVLKELFDRGVENHVPGMLLIDGKSAKEIEPLISDKVIAALHCSSAGIVDPFNFTYAMVENACANNVEFKTETEVVQLKKTEKGIQVKTTNGVFHAKYVINAAGLNSDKIAQMAGDFDFTIIPTKGIYRILKKDPKFSVGTVLFQTPTKKGKGVLVTSTYEGNTMIGPSSEKLNKLVAPIPEEQSLETIDRLSKLSIPTIELQHTIRIFTGIRAKPNTGDFMIYPSKKMEGLVHVGGIESPGLSSAPAIAVFVKSILEGIGLALKAKKSFNPHRKRIPRLAHLDENTRKKLIDENALFSERVCRCETVSEAEIVKAIQDGAVTLDGVKRRVRAGMGFCQGKHCGPKVTALLARELGIPEADIKEETHGSELVKKYS